MSNSTPIAYDVFLSHNSSDKPAVELLGDKLRAAGLRPFLDKWHLIPGKAWQKELTDALEESACTAIFFGPSGEGAWHNQEMQIALNKAARTRDDYRVIPVLLPESDPSQVDGFLELRTWVDFRPGLNDEVAFKRLLAAVKGEPPEGETHELLDDPQPYRGLERFDSEQAEFFFGRDPEIRRLIDRLEDERFVAVVGASGSGKSSLVRAGLSTDTAEKQLQDIRDWYRITLIPGGDPLRALATRLVSHLPETERRELVQGYAEDFQCDPYGLITALQTLFPKPDNPILLMIDQFEELYSHQQVAAVPNHRESTGDRMSPLHAFAANLLAAQACQG